MGSPLLFQSPLSGYTDSPWRKIVKEYGADVVYSEMISSIGIVRNHKKTLSLAYFTTSEKPIFLQIFGADPEIMKDAAVMLVDKFAPDGIDINMGCPVKKVVKSGAGAALLKNINLAKKIVKKVKSGINCPLSIKMRIGWDKDESLKIAREIEDAGADILVIHPRTREQFFEGMADWEVMKKIKSCVRIKVIGNGDVKNPHQAKDLYEFSGVDGIMIGRASIEKPYIFSTIKTYFKTGTALPIEDEENFQIIVKYINYECDYRGEEMALRYIRKVIVSMLRGRRNSHKIKNEIFKMDNKDAVLKILKGAFADDRTAKCDIRT